MLIPCTLIIIQEFTIVPVYAIPIYKAVVSNVKSKHIGIDLYSYLINDFYNIADINNLLSSYYTNTQSDAIIANYYTKTQSDATIANYYTNTDLISYRPRNQTGLSFATGFDLSISKNAALYFRQRWMNYQDKSFIKDRYIGTESTLELKIFF